MELSDIHEIRGLLSRHGFSFDKRLGQNFLIDPDVCPHMADEAIPGPEYGVLEIGPGIGVLTVELARRAAKVVSVELDDRLFPILEETLAGFDNVHLVSSGVTDVFEEISKLKENDVLVGISFPRYSSRTLEAMRFAKRCGAQVVAITDGPMSPLADMADATLTARTDMASFVDSLAAPLSLINALLVALGLHRKEALKEHFRQLESIWETYEVYLEEASNHA